MSTSENRESYTFSVRDFIHEVTRQGDLLPRPRKPRSTLRRNVLRRRQVHRHLLPHGLPGPYPQIRKLHLLLIRCSSTGGRISPMPALPPRDCARDGLMARNLQHSLPCPRAHRRRSPRWRRQKRRCTSRTSRPRRAPAPKTLPPTPRSLAHRSRTNPARPLRQTSHP